MNRYASLFPQNIKQCTFC